MAQVSISPRVSSQQLMLEIHSTRKTPIFEEWTEIAGQQIANETHKIPIVAGSKVTRVITVLRDITDRKQLKAQLRQA